MGSVVCLSVRHFTVHRFLDTVNSLLFLLLFSTNVKTLIKEASLTVPRFQLRSIVPAFSSLALPLRSLVLYFIILHFNDPHFPFSHGLLTDLNQILWNDRSSAKD